uniref:Deoxyribodipyrimidine photo-lyase n=1 Tax=Cyprinus carpio TaxID=7962 RepID=A0A8C1UKN5_CYPCA
MLLYIGVVCAEDNWALIYARQLALAENLPLQDLTHIQYNFMLKGLREVAKECKSLDIQFHLLSGEPGQTLPSFVRNWKFGAVVTDFNPLRIPLQWIETIKKHLMSLLFRCFSHYYFYTSGRLEYGARTIRGKITKLLAEFLREIPLVDTHPHSASRAAKPVDWRRCCRLLRWSAVLERWTGLSWAPVVAWPCIDHHRNNPNCDALSHLSPWIHAGQSVVCSACGEAGQTRKERQSVASFTEELVVRREPADNFCFYNHNYDNTSGAYDWAKKTLQDHAKDCRQYLYTKEQLENAKTHDQLWNAAQRQLVLEGKMHGFLRMNWAKKILEWTASPEEALSIAVFLNDRLSLDGYVGCMWSVCGIHDQGWAERPIFGKIHFMNYAGCKRKFDVAQFERKYAAVKFHWSNSENLLTCINFQFSLFVLVLERLYLRGFFSVVRGSLLIRCYICYVVCWYKGYCLYYVFTYATADILF